jgi:hypothetical protein
MFGVSGIHMDARNGMRIIPLLTIITLTVSLAALPAEGRTGQVGAMVGLGSAVAISDLSQCRDLPVLLTAGFRFKPAPVSSPELNLLLTGEYFSFPSSEADCRDYQFLTLGLAARLRMGQQGTSTFYVTAGGGFARTTYGEYRLEGRLVNETTENNPYLMGGAGMVVPVSSALNLFIEIRVQNVFGTQVKNLTSAPVLAGVTF